MVYDSNMGKGLIKDIKVAIFKFRKIFRVVIESLLWLFSSIIASLIRYDGFLKKEIFNEVLLLGLLASFIYFLINTIFAVYKTKFMRASFEEIVRISLSILFTTLILFIIRIAYEFPRIPVLIPILCGIISLILHIIFRIIVSGRFNKRIFHRTHGVKTLVYGSGITGQQVVDQMLYKSDYYYPIGFLDDDIQKSNFMYRGRKVLGTIQSLPEVVHMKNPEILVVAIAGISSANLIRLEQKCKELRISIRIIPNALEIMKKNLKLSDISELSIEELLGRQQVNYKNNDLVGFFRNKRILITGAGGSIGSEIARQIAQIGTSNLFLLDRNENSLLDLCLSINNDGLFVNNNIVLCDIRDSETVSKLVSELKPDIVFHAAALKHLVLLENFPEEAHKTNVVATKNLINCCLENNVQYFINISTDKAAEPISQLGKSKYLCERIIAGIDVIDKNIFPLGSEMLLAAMAHF